MAPALKNVVLIGAGGNLGPHILKALDSDPYFTLSILSRKSSKSTFPSHIKVHSIGDDYPESELLEAFKGQDAVVSTISATNNQQQHAIIDAAIKAGVKRFIPAEFGANSQDKGATELVPIFAMKNQVTDYLRTKEAKGLTWSAIVTGAFFDWGLQTGFLGFDLAARKAQIYDSGNVKWSATTLSSVGLSVTGTLKNAEKTANQHIFVDSFTISQNELLASLEKATGKKWEVEHMDSEKQTKWAQQAMKDGNMGGLYTLLLIATYSGKHGGDFPAHQKMANDLLGLPKENMDDVVAAVVKGSATG